MSKLSKMLLHQAGIFSRQSSPGLSELMINASKRILQQKALLKEKQVEVDECDLRCAELESGEVVEGVKHDCIGEFKVAIEVDEGCDCCDVCDCDTMEIQHHTIPWTTMKDIFKMMSKSKAINSIRGDSK